MRLPANPTTRLFSYPTFRRNDGSGREVVAANASEFPVTPVVPPVSPSLSPRSFTRRVGHVPHRGKNDVPLGFDIRAGYIRAGYIESRRTHEQPAT